MMYTAIMDQARRGVDDGVDGTWDKLTDWVNRPMNMFFIFPKTYLKRRDLASIALAYGRAWSGGNTLTVSAVVQPDQVGRNIMPSSWPEASVLFSQSPYMFTFTRIAGYQNTTCARCLRMFHSILFGIFLPDTHAKSLPL